jgi:ABC-type phosphate transport system substrate-binding protein
LRPVRASARSKTVWAALAVLVLSLGPAVLSASPAAASNAPITGGGSGFAALEINQWQADTARRPYNLSVNYSAQGSSFGRGQFASGQLDFGASDVVYVPNDWGAGSLQQLLSPRCHGAPLPNCFRYVPVSAGGLSFMYNLYDNGGNRVTNLQLTRQQVCRIFTYQITDWGQILPGFSGRPIKVYARSDGAGESYVLSQFCLAVDPADWQAFISSVGSNPDLAAPDLLAHQPVSNWPQVPGPGHNFVSGADALANSVASGDTGKDSIGYDAAGYAKVRSVPVASVQNAAGLFTQPDETNVTVALAYATPNLDPTQLGTFHLNFNGADTRSYFPSTYSYILAQTGGWDPNKGSTLAQFLCYAVGEGQVIAPNLRYARLSAPIVAISVDAINHIPSNGPCVPSGPPPPPPIAVTPGSIPNGTTTTIGPGGTSGTSQAGNGGANSAGGVGTNGPGAGNAASSANGGSAGGGGSSADSGSGGPGGAGGSNGSGGCPPALEASTSTSSTTSPAAAIASATKPAGSTGAQGSTTTSSTVAAQPCRVVLNTNLASPASHSVDNGQVILTLLLGAVVGFIGGALLVGLRRRASA